MNRGWYGLNPHFSHFLVAWRRRRRPDEARDTEETAVNKTDSQGPKARFHWKRFPFLALGGAALVIGLLGGLLRLGWQLPAPAAAWHGPLIVGGFLGTLIGLERAVALGKAPAYLAPLLSGTAGLVLVAGGSPTTAAALLVASSLIFLLVSVRLVLLQPRISLVVMALGAVAWSAGNLLWFLSLPIAEVVPFWIAFPVLTVAGERLDLSRVIRLSRVARQVFAGLVVLYLAGVALSPAGFESGPALASSGLVLLAAWLVRYDPARHSLRRPGLPRYMAVSILSGYFWLALAGVLGVFHDGSLAGPRYDAWIHAVLVGFLFSMIFAHGPLIFPSILGPRIPFRGFFYLPVWVLNVSLLVRLAGDLAAGTDLRMWGGLGNALAIGLFFLAMAGSAMAASRATSEAASRRGVPLH